MTDSPDGVRGAMALRDVADRLRALGPMDQRMESIVLDAERCSSELINAWVKNRDEAHAGR